MTGPGLCDDPLLAHAACEQTLPQGIVDLVRPGVTEVLALEIYARAAEVLGEPAGKVKRSLAAGIVAIERRELGLERPIVLPTLVRVGELEDRRHQSLGDVSSAELAEAAAAVR